MKSKNLFQKVLFLFYMLFALFAGCEKEELLIPPDNEYFYNGNTLKSGPENFTVYYSNELFIRETGKPVTVARTIGSPNLAEFTECLKLHVKCGLNGSNYVSSAVVKIDGIELLNGSDFTNSEQEFSFDLCNLTETSQMQIIIYGAPGSAIEVWIDGTRRNNLKQDLISYWPIDEIYGLTVSDVHASNNCTVNENVYINQPGLIGRAASFDNSWSGLSTGKTASVLGVGGNHSISVSIWIKPDNRINGLNSCGIIELGSGANQEQFGIKYWAAPAFWMFDSWYGSVRIGQNDDKLADGIWHHIVVTYNSDSHKVTTYLDGNYVTEDTSKVLNITDGNGFYIGVGSQGPYMGLIDEVGLWSRALTGEEVGILYNGGAGLQYPF
jgi:hypothetical protein